MSFKRKAREHWHNIYYAVTFDAGERFAMTCKDASARVDLGPTEPGMVANVRFYLHLSLCQACTNYLNASRALKKLVFDSVHKQDGSEHLTKMNRDLLARHRI